MLHFATLTVVACSINMNRLDMVPEGAGAEKSPDRHGMLRGYYLTTDTVFRLSTYQSKNNFIKSD
jgi:hypothetical protein